MGATGAMEGATGDMETDLDLSEDITLLLAAIYYTRMRPPPPPFCPPLSKFLAECGLRGRVPVPRSTRTEANHFFVDATQARLMG